MNKILPIKNFPNYYVDDEGCIYSNKYGKLKKLKPQQKNGYKAIQLYKNHKIKRCYVHRIVAIAFIENPLNKPHINHKNGVRTDNSVENLEWVTRSENILHAFRVLKRKTGWGGKYGKDNSNSKIVLQIKNGKIICEFFGINEAGRKLKINPSDISRCCLGKRQTAGGYQWKHKKGD